MSFYRAGMLGLALLTIVQVVETNAQTIPVMGYVAAKNANPKRLEIFKKGLAELGYVEGKNIRIEYSEAALDAEYNGVMAELVDRKIDIIAAANVAATRAAAKATKTIPIVMLAVFDPVGIGVVKSLERPSTNVTARRRMPPNLSANVCKRSNASSPPSTKWRWPSMATIPTTPPSSDCSVQRPRSSP